MDMSASQLAMQSNAKVAESELLQQSQQTEYRPLQTFHLARTLQIANAAQQFPRIVYRFRDNDTGRFQAKFSHQHVEHRRIHEVAIAAR